MPFKFKDENIKKYSNKPGGGAGDFSNKWIKKYKNFYKATENLTPEKFIVGEDFGIIQLTYKELQAKTSRFVFRDNISSLKEVPQRDTKIFYVNKELYLSIVYQLTVEEIEKFVELLNSIREKIGPILTIDFYNNLLKSEKNVFTKVINFFKISIPNNLTSKPAAFVKLFNIGNFQEVIDLLEENDISLQPNEIIDKKNMIVYLSRENTTKLTNVMPWIISEVISAQPFSIDLNQSVQIPGNFSKRPNNQETIVGVIDSGFNPSSPFMPFIDSLEDHRQSKIGHDYTHGSATTSLIIDNDFINPSNPDGLGCFKVRHFEILEPNNGEVTVNWAYLYKKLKEIVSNNTDIRVWNLSLGGPRSDIFGISSHGMLLDRLSKKFNCIFVIAAGNSRNKVPNENHSLCSPADSVNNISVGSVSELNGIVSRASYSSLGFVLQSIKPDISHFGGPTLPGGLAALVHNGLGKISDSGTSYSAPKVSRFLAKFINDGMSIMEAKAKIISLAEKEKPSLASSRYGFLTSKDNFFEISQSIPVYSKDLVLIEMDIPEDVEEIIVSTSYLIEPQPLFGHESTIYEIRACLAEFNTETKKLKNGSIKHYGLSSELASSKIENRSKAFLREEQMRFNLGKYSTSKKVKYNWSKIKSDIKREKVGIKITRLDLHDINNSEPINASVNIKFVGENLTEEKMMTITQIENIVMVPDIEFQMPDIE